MRFAKRLFFTALGLILFIAAVGWGYWTYRQYRASQTPIPRDATSVVRIHVDGLIRDIAWNALWNRAAYRDTTEQPGAVSGLKRWKPPGIPIPSSLFLYQLDHARSGEFPDVYFTSLAVDDPAAFAAWLHDNLGMEANPSENGTVAFSERTLVVIRPERALLALSPTKPNAPISLLTDVLANLWQQQDRNVAVSESDFREVMHNDGQMSGRGAHRFSFDFGKGFVTFNGRYRLDATTDRLENTPHFDGSNAASLWAQGGLTRFLAGRLFNIGGHTLHGDSLLRHYRGRIAVEWKGTTTQQDTVINFDYDDNFELVETREIVDKSVPEIYCSILADTGLISYLNAQGVLEAPSNTVSRDVFPLFRLDVSTRPSGYVQFHTAPAALALPPPSDRGNELLYLRVDFSKLEIPDLPASLAPYEQAADFLELSGQPASANEVAVHGTLHLKDPQLHSLVQLLALLN